jgi:hypothetical protein
MWIVCLLLRRFSQWLTRLTPRPYLAPGAGPHNQPWDTGTVLLRNRRWSARNCFKLKF